MSPGYMPGARPARFAPNQPKLPLLSVKERPVQPFGRESVTHPPAARGAPFEVRVAVRFTVPPRGPEARDTVVGDGVLVPLPLNLSDWLPEGRLPRILMPRHAEPDAAGPQVS